MFYIAVVNGDHVPRYSEHYEIEEGFLKRLPGLRLQASVEGIGWELYTGDQPYECYRVRVTTPPKEGEDVDEYESRVRIAVKHALDSSVSRLTPTMLDDRPEWYKLGYESAEGMVVALETEKHLAEEIALEESLKKE